MAIEEEIVAALSGLFSGRVYADIAPATAQHPFCIYQQVGGRPVTTICGGRANRSNARFQFWVWSQPSPSGGGREEASTLMRSIADELMASPIFAVPLSELTADFDDVTRTYGARQDFSIWS